MRKTLASAILAATCAAPMVAHAEGTPITVKFQYDGTLLATEAGAKAVLDSVKLQAKEACSYNKPVTGMPTYDRDCQIDLVEKAISEIRLAAVELGQPATFVFASLEADEDTIAQ